MHKNIRFADTLQFLPKVFIGMPDVIKLPNLKLSTVYGAIFGKETENSHSATGDVKALSDIIVHCAKMSGNSMTRFFFKYMKSFSYPASAINSIYNASLQ